MLEHNNLYSLDRAVQGNRKTSNLFKLIMLFNTFDSCLSKRGLYYPFRAENLRVKTVA